jgi:hypothetical protein
MGLTNSKGLPLTMQPTIVSQDRHVHPDCLRKERALSQVYQPLIEKGCSDHITALCAKEWEQHQCSGKVLGIASSSPPTGVPELLHLHYEVCVPEVHGWYLEGCMGGLCFAPWHQAGQHTKVKEKQPGSYNQVFMKRGQCLLFTNSQFQCTDWIGLWSLHLYISHKKHQNEMAAK